MRPLDITHALTITVPMLPSSLNKWTRAHWTTRNGEHKAWVAAMEPRLLLAGCRKGHPLWAGPVEVALVYHVARKKGGKAMDVDNMAPKHAIDAMKGWVFPDDGPSYLPRLVQSVVLGAKSDCTVITVTPLHAPELDRRRVPVPLKPYVPVEPVERLGGPKAAGRKRTRK